MLGKLLKYEFRATGRVFLPFFGALIVVSVINRIISLFSPGESTYGFPQAQGAPYIIGTVLSIMLMVAVFVVAFVLMIQRFSKNLIGDEGYLMFTLPVSVDSLIFSKLIVSTVWFLLSIVVVMISIVIMSLMDVRDVISNIGRALERIFTGGVGDIIMGIQTIILTLVTLFASTLSFYMCISLAMLFNRRRGLISVGFFLLLITVMQILGVLGVGFINTDLAGTLFGWIGNLTAPVASNMTMLGSNLLMLIGGGIMYFVTRYMLSRKLNLE